MSFDLYEKSYYHGEPVNLFLFEYGLGVTVRLGITDAEEPIEHDGVVFEPRPLQRAPINASGTLDKTTLEIRTDRESEVAELFRVHPPSNTVRLTILQGHMDDPDKEFLVIWTGRVLNVKWESSSATLTCEPIATSLRRPGLRRRYQIACPHVLYGPICRANKEAATTDTRLVEAVGMSRQVKVQQVLADNFLKAHLGGTMEWVKDGQIEMRTIVQIVSDESGSVLTLTGVVRDLSDNHPVQLVMGCGHNLEDCANLHNNLPNYGGMPWIPTKNPFGKYSPYY